MLAKIVAFGLVVYIGIALLRGQSFEVVTAKIKKFASRHPKVFSEAGLL